MLHTYVERFDVMDERENILDWDGKWTRPSVVRPRPSIHIYAGAGRELFRSTDGRYRYAHRRDSYGIKHAAACAGVQCAASTVLHPPYAYVPAMQSYVQCMAWSGRSAPRYLCAQRFTCHLPTEKFITRAVKKSWDSGHEMLIIRLPVLRHLETLYNIFFLTQQNSLQHYIILVFTDEGGRYIYGDHVSSLISQGRQ
jgi:hypothetical protein